VVPAPYADATATESAPLTLECAAEAGRNGAPCVSIEALAAARRDRVGERRRMTVVNRNVVDRKSRVEGECQEHPPHADCDRIARPVNQLIPDRIRGERVED